MEARSRPSLEREFVSCPITALAFCRLSSMVAGDGTGAAAGDDDNLGKPVLGGFGKRQRLLYILAGEDTQLKVFDARTARLCGQLRVFESSVVHGICVVASACGGGGGNEEEDEGTVLIWGGSSVAVLPLRALEGVVARGGEGEGVGAGVILEAVTAPDWIYDGILTRTAGRGSKRRGVLVTARNEVLPISIRAGNERDKTVVTLGRVVSPSRPVLYSANLRWATAAEDEVLVAGGTVFGEIVVWRCRFGQQQGEDEFEILPESCEVLYVLSGHEGSIFGVHISQELELELELEPEPEPEPPNQSSDDGAGNNHQTAAAKRKIKARLLVSCSDDRTVRVWDITDRPRRLGVPEQLPPLQPGQQQESPTAATAKISRQEESRETGFGGGLGNSGGDGLDGLPLRPEEEGGGGEEDEEEAASGPRPLAVAMGHLSRIWHVRVDTTRGAGDRFDNNLGPVAARGGQISAAVYSFGEDATVQEWRLTVGHRQRRRRQQRTGGEIAPPPPPPQISTSNNCDGDHPGPDSELAATLTHARTMHCHGGKHIWSTAMFGGNNVDDTDVLSQPLLIATGGADGKIALLGAASQFCSEEDGDARSNWGTGGGKRGGGGLELGHTDVSCSFSDVVSAAAAPLTQPKPILINPVVTTEGAVSTGEKAKAAASAKLVETFKNFAFLSEDQLLVSSTFGRVFLGTVVEDDEIGWTQVEVPDSIRDDLRGYNVVKSSRVAGDAIFLGSATGGVYMFSSPGRAAAAGHGLVKIAELGRKVADIFVLQPKAQTSGIGAEARTELVVAVLGHDEAYHLSISPGSTLPTIWPVPLEKGDVVTSATESNGYLILGTRDSKLLFYHKALVPNAGSGSSSNASYSFVRSRGSPVHARTKDAITSIVPLPGWQPGQESPYILTTCRDGRYLIYEVSADDDEAGEDPKLELLHDTSPPFGPVIVEAWFEFPTSSCSSSSTTTTTPPELILCGFRSRFFVIWNETRQEEIASVDCGGVHRTYAYVIPPPPTHSLTSRLNSNAKIKNGLIRFAYSKSQRTHVYTQQQHRRGHGGNAITTTLKTGTHGREIRAVSCCGAFLATAAEDTTVRIWRWEYEETEEAEDAKIDGGGGGGKSTKRLRCVAALDAHTAGLQALRWCKGGKYLVSSAGNEELFVWRVRSLSAAAAASAGKGKGKGEEGKGKIGGGGGGSAYEGLAVVCEARYPDRTADADLRILSVDVSDSGGGGRSERAAEDDNTSSPSFYISLALSNSVLKTYWYSRSGGFVLLATGRYTGHCLTQIRHLRVGGGGPGATQPRVLTASTDGMVVVWEADAESSGVYAIVGCYRLHHSSIKSLDVMPLQAAAGNDDGDWDKGVRRWAVVTGGDDNAIGVLQIGRRDARGQDHSHGYSGSRAIARSAHAAGITGICILGSPPTAETGVLLAASVSNDQRLKVWRVRLDDDGRGRVGVQLLEDRYSAVADAGDLEFVPAAVSVSVSSSSPPSSGDGGAYSGGKLVVVGVGVEVWDVTFRDKAAVIDRCDK